MRYGYYTGTVNLSDEEYQRFIEDPIKTLYDLDLIQDLSFEVEDYEIDDIGGITDVDWSEE